MLRYRSPSVKSRPAAPAPALRASRTGASDRLEGRKRQLLLLTTGSLLTSHGPADHPSGARSSKAAVRVDSKSLGATSCAAKRHCPATRWPFARLHANDRLGGDFGASGSAEQGRDAKEPEATMRLLRARRPIQPPHDAAARLTMACQSPLR